MGSKPWVVETPLRGRPRGLDEYSQSQVGSPRFKLQGRWQEPCLVLSVHNGGQKNVTKSCHHHRAVVPLVWLIKKMPATVCHTRHNTVDQQRLIWLIEKGTKYHFAKPGRLLAVNFKQIFVCDFKQKLSHTSRYHRRRPADRCGVWSNRLLNRDWVFARGRL